MTEAPAEDNSFDDVFPVLGEAMRTSARQAAQTITLKIKLVIDGGVCGMSRSPEFFMDLGIIDASQQ
jgi:hypothetical protein